MIVGFDQQIFRTLPPPHELVLKGAPVRGLAGEDGSELRIVFPDDAPEPPARADNLPASTDDEPRAPDDEAGGRDQRP